MALLRRSEEVRREEPERLQADSLVAGARQPVQLADKPLTVKAVLGLQEVAQPSGRLRPAGGVAALTGPELRHSRLPLRGGALKSPPQHGRTWQSRGSVWQTRELRGDPRDSAWQLRGSVWQCVAAAWQSAPDNRRNRPFAEGLF